MKRVTVYWHAPVDGRSLILSTEKRAVADYLRRRHGYDYVVAQPWGVLRASPLWTRVRVYGERPRGDTATVAVMAGPLEPVLPRTRRKVQRLVQKLEPDAVVHENGYRR